MKPEKLAESGTESGHQRALFAAVNDELWQLQCQLENERGLDHQARWDGINRRWAQPLMWLHSIPNGGSRGDTARSRAIRGAVMKAEGVKEGIPDIFLPCPRITYSERVAGLYIEMKKPGGKPSKEQLEFRDYALSVGYAWHLCDTWEKAFDVIKSYLKD